LLRPATSADLNEIAALHAASWRIAYRGLLPDTFLDQQLESDRLEFWNARFASVALDRRLVLNAVRDGALVGFVCVLLDLEPQWGARLDNLHVAPQLKGTGIGYELFKAAREWVASVQPGTAMHLWCLEENQTARRFYDRQGGVVVESAVRDVAMGLKRPELRYFWPAQS
jgi:GNAT superfamily N-acetyltransferase